MNITPEVQAMIDAAVAAAVATKKAKGSKKAKSKKGTGKGRVPLTDEQRAAFIAQNDAECVKVFTEAGFKDVQPRVNVLTYKRWVAAGRLVRKGEKSHKVGSFSLFHLDQTDETPAGTATVN